MEYRDVHPCNFMMASGLRDEEAKTNSSVGGGGVETRPAAEISVAVIPYISCEILIINYRDVVYLYTTVLMFGPYVSHLPVRNLILHYT